MNSTVKKIIEQQEVSALEIFELINSYNITSLYYKEDNNTFRLQINHFETYNDVFEFSQRNIDENSLSVKKSDIGSVKARYEEDADFIIINCQMVENKKLDFVIYYVSNDFSISENDGYYEIEVYDLHEFLEDALHSKEEITCFAVKIYDKYGLFLRMICPTRVFINTLDEDDWKLHISDNSTEFNISVIDDYCSNTFYRKDTDSSIEIVVKPYGQPFMEVRMLFQKV